MLGFFRGTSSSNDSFAAQQRSNDSSEALRLLQACEIGDIAEVKRITVGGALPFRTVLNRLSEPVVVACKHDHLDVIQALLDKGILFDSSILNVACAFNRKEIFIFFFLRMEKQRVFSVDNLTSMLHSASSAAVWGILEFLNDHLKKTPELREAVLLEANTYCLFHIVCSGVAQKKVRKLNSRMHTKNKVSPIDNEPAAIAIVDDMVRTIEYLANELNLDPNYPDMFSETGLHIACRTNVHPLVVEALLRVNALKYKSQDHLFLKNAFGEEPFYLLATQTFFDIMIDAKYFPRSRKTLEEMLDDNIAIQKMKVFFRFNFSVYEKDGRLIRPIRYLRSNFNKLVANYVVSLYNSERPSADLISTSCSSKESSNEIEIIDHASNPLCSVT